MRIAGFACYFVTGVHQHMLPLKACSDVYDEGRTLLTPHLGPFWVLFLDSVEGVNYPAEAEQSIEELLQPHMCNVECIIDAHKLYRRSLTSLTAI